MHLILDLTTLLSIFLLLLTTALASPLAANEDTGPTGPVKLCSKETSVCVTNADCCQKVCVNLVCNSAAAAAKRALLDEFELAV